MKKTIFLCLIGLFIYLFCLWSVVQAGDLNPPGPPTAGTMKPLDQVEPRKPLKAGFVPVGAEQVILISQPESYYLTAGFSTSFRHGIKITASHVKLDLMGFRIYSSWTATPPMAKRTTSMIREPVRLGLITRLKIFLKRRKP